MYYAKQNNGSLITAHEAQRGSAYFCPHCAETVVLRQGTVKRAHFTHIKRNCRPNHSGETLTHYKAKYRLAQDLQLLGYEVQIEPQIRQGSQIPDLLLNNKVVVELQFSNITLVELQRRTSNYELLGYMVCWVVLLPTVKYNYFKLTDFQSACIQPQLRRLFAWHPTSERLYVITQIQLTEQWVAKHLGHVYPEQLLIKTHPVLWQLRYIYELQLPNFQVTQVVNSLKRRTFATPNINTTKELQRLINRFAQHYKTSKQYNVQN